MARLEMRNAAPVASGSGADEKGAITLMQVYHGIFRHGNIVQVRISERLRPESVSRIFSTEEQAAAFQSWAVEQSRGLSLGGFLGWEA